MKKCVHINAIKRERQIPLFSLFFNQWHVITDDASGLMVKQLCAYHEAIITLLVIYFSVGYL